MSKIIKTGAALLAATSILAVEIFSSAQTVITAGDLSVEGWIAAGEGLNMQDYAQGAEEFYTALSDLKSAKFDYDHADNPEYSAISALKKAWDGLKYEQQSEKPLFKGKTFTKQSTFSLEKFDYKNGETPYIVLNDYSKFSFTVSTTGTGEYGNSVDLQIIDKSGKKSDTWYGAAWGSNSKESSVIKYVADITEKTKLNSFASCSALYFSLNNYGGKTCTVSDIYGYRRLTPAYPAGCDGFSLSDWIAAAKALDISACTEGTEEFKNAIKTAEIARYVMNGGKVSDYEALIALREAWQGLGKEQREEVSLINATSGIPTNSGFAIPFVKSADLKKYGKFDIVINCQNYKSDAYGYGTSLNFQFNKSSGGYYEAKYVWFNANKEESIKTLTSEALAGETEKTVISSVKVQGAKEYPLAITVKGIYGYYYDYASLPENSDGFTLSDWITAAKALDISGYTVGTDEFTKALNSAIAAQTGISEKESQAIADLRAAWNNMKKTERQGLLTESKTEIPTTGGFAVPFKKKINLEDYEKFDFAADCRNYANTTGGVSINIQMNKAGGGYYEVKYKWFNAKKEESVITVQTDALVGNAEKTVCSSVKFQGAQKYSLPITLNEVYGYKRVTPAVPGNADEMNLKSWIAASKALDTADYSNTDEFSAAVTAAEKTLSELEAEQPDEQPETPVDYSERKAKAYDELKLCLSAFKSAWKNLRVKEYWVLAVPADAAANTETDDIPAEFGDYAVYTGVEKTSKYYYKLINRDIVGIDKLEIHLRAVNKDGGTVKSPTKNSFMLQVSSEENGRSDVWSYVSGTAYTKVYITNNAKSALWKYTEIGSDPLSGLSFMSGYNEKSSLVCDELTLGTIYGIRYNKVPYPDGAAGEKSGADTSALRALTAHGKKFSSSDFSVASWKPFKKALAQAEAVLNDLTASQETVNAAREKLLSVWGNLIYYQRVPLFDVAENLEWGLEYADNLVYPQYVSVSDKTLPSGLTSYVKMTDVPEKWHKLAFRQMTNKDASRFDYIEFYMRSTDKLVRGEKGCLYIQINSTYELWTGFTASNGQWGQCLAPLNKFTSRLDKTSKFIEKSGKIGAVSFSLSSGAYGDIDISSANLVRCIRVEAGKDPVTEESGSTISLIGEDYSNDIFDCRYDPADDGEAFVARNIVIPETKNEKPISRFSSTAVIITVCVILLAGGAAAGVICYTKKRRIKR